MSADGATGRGNAPVLSTSVSVREFLARLERQTDSMPRKTPLPEQPATDFRAVGASDDLLERFVAAANAAGCRAYRATEESWITTVCDILRGRSVRRVVAEPQAESVFRLPDAAKLTAALVKDGIATVGDRDDETLFAADAAITGVRSAVAETGTIVCVSGPTSARGSSLVPPLHVALVGESQIVPDLFDLFDELARGGAGAPGPANVNLITGPSKTADIEGVLVTGVHGPGEVHVVVVAAAARA